MPYEIVDTHVHYWEPDKPERPWDPGGVNIGEPLSVEQLLDDAAEAGVTKIVQVTPTIMGYDNRYGIEAAQRYPDRIASVFGRFDPSGSDMRERLVRFREQPAILGVRLTLIKPPWDTWLADGTLDAFWDEAARLDLPVAVYAPHQAELIAEAARRHPATRILVDHMTLRYQDADPFARWPEIFSLVDRPNVSIKVSYFPEVARERYPFPAMQRYFRELFERFGPDRLIWGSNYPPSREACAYAESVSFVRDALAFLTVSDKEKILGSTFMRVAGLN